MPLVVSLLDIQDIIQKMSDKLQGNYSFTPDNVYQAGNRENRAVIGRLVDEVTLPGSRIDNAAALIELVQKCRNGESCLLLAEHFGNFDFPTVYRLMEKTPGLGPQAAEMLLPIRGMKLTETNPLTAVFARSFDTIVIYPSRFLDKISDPQELKEVRKLSVPINHAAMREMITHKHNGRLILVFPAGTRYRPWDPDSGKGVREIYSYLKAFDNVIFMAINGNTLPPSKTEDMTQDKAEKDLMILTCSNVINSRQFKKDNEKSTPADRDSRQYVVDQVMEELRKLHAKVEPARLKELARIKPSG
ncbi:MAG: hypothetical protein B0D92_02225 [Spirochaeta sp. LUC14_002_19_P3]|nr:MAG: hypothetical protein B0D92_02225 [Spirochaeta sp. LUC14_002_19_P3]